MDKAAADPKLTAESSWGLLGGGYFFGTDHDDRYKEDSSILSEFGWNIPAESNGGVCGCDGRFLDLDRIGSDFDGCASADTPAPMAVVEESRSALAPSISSEDPTASGGSSAGAAAAVNPLSDSA